MCGSIFRLGFQELSYSRSIFLGDTFQILKQMNRKAFVPNNLFYFFRLLHFKNDNEQNQEIKV